jgi:hypothetical protein
LTQSVNNELYIKISSNGIPKINNMSKKELDLFISCLELEIRDFHIKEKKQNKNIPP